MLKKILQELILIRKELQAIRGSQEFQIDSQSVADAMNRQLNHPIQLDPCSLGRRL